MLVARRLALVVILLLPIAGCLNDPPGDVGIRWREGGDVEVLFGLCPDDFAIEVLLAHSQGRQGNTTYWRIVANDQAAGSIKRVYSATAPPDWTERVRYTQPPPHLDLVLFVDTATYDYAIEVPAESRPSDELLTAGGQYQSPDAFDSAATGDCP
jgi:hypothetical protein